MAMKHMNFVAYFSDASSTGSELDLLLNFFVLGDILISLGVIQPVRIIQVPSFLCVYQISIGCRVRITHHLTISYSLYFVTTCFGPLVGHQSRSFTSSFSFNPNFTIIIIPLFGIKSDLLKSSSHGF
jgi:hypothetical protein